MISLICSNSDKICSPETRFVTITPPSLHLEGIQTRQQKALGQRKIPTTGNELAWTCIYVAHENSGKAIFWGETGESTWVRNTYHTFVSTYKIHEISLSVKNCNSLWNFKYKANKLLHWTHMVVIRSPPLLVDAQDQGRRVQLFVISQMGDHCQTQHGCWSLTYKISSQHGFTSKNYRLTTEA